jgi:hypothetical protein
MIGFMHKTMEFHEGSFIHTECVTKWEELETQLKTKSTINTSSPMLCEME